MSFASLSTGCIGSLMAGVDVDRPVLQILGTKKIASGEGNERYRVLVSDGKHLNSFAMLATQLNELHTQGKLSEFTIIRVDRYITSLVNKSEKGDKRVLIILELTVLNSGSSVGQKIGNPVQYTGTVSSEISKPAPTPSAPKPSVVERNGNPNTSMNNNNTSMSAAGHLISPISSLSPYQNKWVIKVRVMAKSPIRTWNNAKGEGKLFSMDLFDKSGEIRATAFKEAVDKFYDMIEVDKVYLMSKCQLKPANKQFSTLKNDYEMTFGNDTIVQLCEEEATDSTIPQITYNFVEISQIGTMEEKTIVDIIGVCKEASELQQFQSKTTNKEFKKRELTIIDQSNTAVQVTLWGDDAVNFDGYVQPIILVKSGRISEFNGAKSIAIGNSSIMKINPDIPEGHKLRGWFDNGGGDQVTTNLSARGTGGSTFSTDWLSFQEVRDRNLGAGDKPDYFQSKASIHMIKSANAFYKACAQPDCNKKVVEEHEMYRCEKCQMTSPIFKNRFLINMSIADWTSNRWVTCFNDTAETLLGKTADEVAALMTENVNGDDEKPGSIGEDVFSSVCFTGFIFKLRTKLEMYGDTQRNKFSVVAATPINYKEYNKFLVGNLQNLTGIGKK